MILQKPTFDTYHITEYIVMICNLVLTPFLIRDIGKKKKEVKDYEKNDSYSEITIQILDWLRISEITAILVIIYKISYRIYCTVFEVQDSKLRVL